MSQGPVTVADGFAHLAASVRAGVVVLDSNLIVESWNTLAEDPWGLRSDEVTSMRSTHEKRFAIFGVGMLEMTKCAPRREPA